MPPKYRVINPRGIPEGTPVCGQLVSGQARRWYEGDIYDGPDPSELLRRGYLEEVKRGKASRPE